jgi:hypothetical protein
MDVENLSLFYHKQPGTPAIIFSFVDREIQKIYEWICGMVRGGEYERCIGEDG